MKNFYISFLLILIFVVGVAGQQSRKATVTLTNGDVVEGKFLSADSLNISIGIASQKITLLWESIASIQFTEPQTKTTSSKDLDSKPAVSSAVEELELISNSNNSKPQSSSTVLFVGDSTIKKFYPIGCAEINGIYPTSVTNFLSEEDAQKAGFTKSSYCSSKESNPSSPSYTPSTSSSGEVQVKGYYRKDGTYVRPHTRSAPKRKN